MLGDRTSRTISIGVVAAAVALLGCGGSGSKANTSASQSTSTSQTSSTTASSTTATTTTSTTSTQASSAAATPPAFTVSSPALKKTGGVRLLSARYTCNGAGGSLPLHWSHVPANTKELALFIIHEGSHNGSTPVDWAAAGIKPRLSGIGAGGLPGGAVLGRNSKGQTAYSVCPPKSHATEYVIALYSLKHSLKLRAGFSGPAVLAKIERNQPDAAIVLFH